MNCGVSDVVVILASKIISRDTKYLKSDGCSNHSDLRTYEAENERLMKLLDEFEYGTEGKTI